MMFAPPPPPPPVLTAQQQADLDCLDLGLTLQTSAGAPKRRPTLDLAAVFLQRLQRSDPSRDWTAIAAALPDSFTYGDFMKRMSACETRAHREPRDR